MESRVDRMIEAAARGLAGRRTRREVLGRGGVLCLGGACLGIEPVMDAFTAVSEARPYGSWRERAFGQREVNVCYTPMRVVGTEAAVARMGLTGVLVRKGPSFGAPPAPRNDGGLTIIPVGTHAARQSVRRAKGPGCPPAKPRRAVNGFVWAYPADDVSGNKSGWVPLHVEGDRYLAPDAGYGRRPSDPEEWVCGPASHDIDSRSEASKAYCEYECEVGDTRRGLRFTGRTRRVIGAGGEPANSAEEYYLRWAASSTPFAYLAPKDVVFELGRKQGFSYGPNLVAWSFVEVRRATYVAPGTRGFCLEDAFLPVRKRFKPPHLD